ncbi:DUF7115 domain-containing protein [Halosimplex halophilum]|uniref:DUF7115 domain-containing protein n=1 Tax=Halosimplex halophilum TaxID=2559572 RepID=UPI00107F0A75|nr:hypothetical protein [Halosimplex halophilum]
MDIPDLVKGALDGEEIQAGVSLGDEDAVCLTPTRTLVYRGEGLLSDETVEEYSHDIEQLAVSEGRRKTKFTMQYIDGTESFTVPANRGEKVLELFLEGVLRLDGVIGDRESLAGVYRFSELTLIIAEGRLIKHIGSQVWSEDYEVYAYDDVTGLEFERASVATSIALSVEGRPQRIKVPNDKAPVVRQTLEGALFDYYDVANVEELNRVVGPETDAGGVEPADEDTGDGFSFGDDFDPLVSDEADLAESVEGEERLADDPGAGQPPRQPGGQPEGQPGGRSDDPATGRAADAADGQTADAGGDTADPATGGSSEPVARSGAGSGGSEDRETETEATADRQPDAQQADTGRGETQQADTRRSDTQQADTAGTTDRRGGTDDTAGRTSATDGTADSTAGADASADRTVDDTADTTVDDTADRTVDDTADTTATESGGTSTAGASAASASGTGGEVEPAPITREEFEAMAERLEELTDAVDRQNELLKRQHRALKRLVQQDSE